jgi:hypothetical protein
MQCSLTCARVYHHSVPGTETFPCMHSTFSSTHCASKESEIRSVASSFSRANQRLYYLAIYILSVGMCWHRMRYHHRTRHQATLSSTHVPPPSTDLCTATLPRAFDVELLYLAQRRGYPIREVAVNWTEIDGSHLSIFGSSIQMFRDLLRIRFQYLTGKWRLSDAA